MAADEQVQNADGWIDERTLGGGAFGAVYLYRNQVTGQAIAIKKCRQADDLSEKNRTRWSQECEIMLRLNHPNVVHGLELPDALKSLATGDLPVLAMEYCELGDLRKVLNKPVNCYGLPEFQIRHVVHDISAAVEYLHSQRVIHRDLKPENIVMQNPGNARILYKLIDLGYAKDLTNDSMCTSFVGTMQYLAPELFSTGNPHYTCTVDYWSLGTTIFECITGMRPFLAHLPPVRWLGIVSSKKPEHIHAYLNGIGKLEYSDKLPSPNQLCSLTQVYFEQWLRMMLLWDPKNRGQKHTTLQQHQQSSTEWPRPSCFDFLEKLLTMKLIRIYSVPTNEVVACAITKTTEVPSPVPMIIQNSLHIDTTDQEFLTPAGEVVDMTRDLAEYCLSKDDLPTKDIIDIFVFSKSGSISLPESKKRKPLPRQLQIMLDSREMDRVYADQVEVCKNVIYYCTQTNKDIGRLIDAQRAAKLSLLRERTDLSALILKLKNQLHELITVVDFYSQCVETDLTEFRNQQKTTGTFSKKMYDDWSARRQEMLRFLALKDDVQRIEHCSEDVNVQVQELEHCSLARELPTNQIDVILEQSNSIYEKLRSMPQDMRINAPFSGDIVRCIDDCLLASDRLMADLDSHIRKIMSCKLDVIQLTRKSDALLEKVLKAKDDILHWQRQRQKVIWKLLTMITSQVKKGKLHVDEIDNCEVLVNTNHSPPEPPTLSPPCHELQSLALQDASISMRNRLKELALSFSSDQQERDASSTSYDWSFLDV